MTGLGSKPVILTASKCLPLCPQYRACSNHGGTSELGHIRICPMVTISVQIDWWTR